jgi:hypothetical protein
VRATCHESHPSFKARLNTLRAKKMREIIKRYLPMACVVLMAIGQFLCALGSGHPDTLEPLSDWINTTANVINIVIGIMVFIPRARVLAASLSVVVTVISMVTNYLVDGPGYFLQVLPFSLVLLGVSVYVHVHYVRVRAAALKNRAFWLRR